MYKNDNSTNTYALILIRRPKKGKISLFIVSRIELLIILIYCDAYVNENLKVLIKTITPSG